jgi:hypothetical protein
VLYCASASAVTRPYVSDILRAKHEMDQRKNTHTKKAEAERGGGSVISHGN